MSKQLADALRDMGMRYGLTDAAREALAAHEAEPERAGEAVAYRISCPHEPDIGHWYDEEDLTEHGYTCVPLYTRPQQPLSVKDITALRAEMNTRCAMVGFETLSKIVRLVERAHGITKEPKT